MNSSHNYEYMLKQLEFWLKVIYPFQLITPLKLQEILDSVKETLIKNNPDYDIVIKRLHLYYDIKLVTFAIDIKRNLIIQFPFLYNLIHSNHYIVSIRNSSCSYCREGY